jgi:outer membrane protein assembly factor BamB
MDVVRRESELAVPIVTSVICCLLLLWWFTDAGVESAMTRLAGQDGQPLASTDRRVEGPAFTIGDPIQGDGVRAETPVTWPGFRGQHRDGVVTEGVPLARVWPPDGPPVAWSIELGEGYAGPAVWGGAVYVLDYDEHAGADTLRCLSLTDGQEIWRNSYPAAVTRNHGMSRTVPAIKDGHVVTIGPRCHVVCWKATTGVCSWSIDLVGEHGASEPRWYAGQCPLIDQQQVILAAGGEALLIAVDLQTGDVLWESPNPRGWKTTHASVMVADHHGRRSYIYCGSGGVAAVAADDGSLLWDSDQWPTIFATCPSPVALPDNQVFLCSGYGRTVGSLMLKVLDEDGEFHVEPVFSLKPRQFNSEHHTPIFFDGHLYGVRKAGGGQLVCLDLMGREIWNSGGDRFGHGPYLIADGRIFVMDDHGWLTMAEATPAGYQRLGRHELLTDGHDAWGPMALVAGQLIARDMTRMTCVDLARR